MKIPDLTDWPKEFESLDKLKDKHPALIHKIEPTAEGSHDGPRVGLTKGGKIVAVESESAQLPTYCLVDPKIFPAK